MFTTSLAIKEMQIQTTLGSQLLPVRMTIVKETNDNKILAYPTQGYEGKEEPLYIAYRSVDKCSHYSNHGRDFSKN